MSNNLDKTYRFFISFRGELHSFALDWNKVPEEIAENIPGHYIYNIPVIDSEGKISEATAIYLTPVGDNIEIEGDDCLEILKSNDGKIIMAYFKDDEVL